MFEGSANVAPGISRRRFAPAAASPSAGAKRAKTDALLRDSAEHLLETALWLEADRMAAPFEGRLVAPRRRRAVRSRTSAGRRQSRFPRNALTIAPLLSAATSVSRWPRSDGRFESRIAHRHASVSAHRTTCRTTPWSRSAATSIRAKRERWSSGTLVRDQAWCTCVAHPTIVKQTPLTPSATRIGRSAGADRRFDSPGPRGFGIRIVCHSSRSARCCHAISRAVNKLLVYDRRLASRVVAANFDFEKGGLFQIDVTPQPGASLTAIEQLVDSTLASFDSQPVSAEDLDAFKRSNAVLAITQLQTRAARADTLAHGELFAHDPAAYAKQVNQTFALTSADVHRVAKRYLTAARVVMSMVPAGKLDLIAKPDAPYTNVTPPAPKAAP